MTETLQTRLEHSRSIEDAEKFRALETLKELGVVLPLAAFDLYHGRSSDSEEPWEIDPTFKNGSNDTGNRNINARPTLYTSDEQVAREFAAARAREFVRSALSTYFIDMVRNYTPEQKAEWLTRLRTLAHARHEKYSLDSTPPDITMEDLDKHVTMEARRLEAHTSEVEMAAIKEAIAAKYREEVHAIVTNNLDAVIVDIAFDTRDLDTDEKEAYRKAISSLIIPMTAGSPVLFEDKEAPPQFVQFIHTNKNPIVTLHDVDELVKTTDMSDQAAFQLAGAYNAYRLAHRDIVSLAKLLIRNADDHLITNYNTENGLEKIPLNLEYLARLFREAHIVGTWERVRSATLNGRGITAVSLFDLEQFATAEQRQDERDRTSRKLGTLSSDIHAQLDIHSHPRKHELLDMLTNTYASPEKLVAAAMKVEGFAELFQADTGNWEGFTLAEHTETVLRNFDENFADKVPVELLAPMRLAIISHDIGKPIAAARGHKAQQKMYNIEYATKFYSELGISDRLQKLLLAIIGDGEELAYEAYIKTTGPETMQALRTFAIATLQDFYNTDDISEDTIEGFIDLCKMMQLCDGGAYTSAGITRKETSVYHRNSPSFDTTYQPTKRQLKKV